MSLGARLRAIRTERGIRQKALAETARLTPSLVSQIESGKLSPSLHTLGRLAAALGVPVGAFFEQAPNGRIHVGRRKDYAVVSFDGSNERWEVLAAGLFRGKGFLWLAETGRRYVFHLVGERFTLDDDGRPSPGPNRLVLIGRGLDASDLRVRLTGCLAPS